MSLIIRIVQQTIRGVKVLASKKHGYNLKKLIHGPNRE